MTDREKIAAIQKQREALEAALAETWRNPLRHLSIPVSRRTRASVTFDGPVSREAIWELIEALTRMANIAESEASSEGGA